MANARTPTPVEQKADAAVARLVKFANSFPRPTGQQLVRTDAMRAALAPLRPLAERVAGLAVGTKKGTIAGPGDLNALMRAFVPLYQIAEAIEGRAQPATGYLTGPVVTNDDIITAQFILACCDATLPQYRQPVLDPVMYATTKAQAYRLLMVATDLDIDTTMADQVVLLWGSLKDVVKEYAAALQRGAETGLTLVTVLLIAAGIGGGVYVAKSLFGR
jgi:hypothetical protein